MTGAIEPYRIAVITLPDGGRIGLSRLPGRGHDLDGDLVAIRVFGPALVLTLTQTDEMARNGGGGLPERLAAAGIPWRHLPILDYAVPAAADPRWPPIAGEMHAVLDAGGAVLVHCAGGCGRSGMVAARLVAERGVRSETAIAMVRAARPCAIETPAQEAWVKAAARP